MSNGSNEQELPEEMGTDQSGPCGVMVADDPDARCLLENDHPCAHVFDLSDAIEVITTLTAQAENVNEQREDLASLGSEWKHRAEKAEAELSTANQEIDALTSKLASTEYGGYQSRIRILEAELAALREGATVRYCVQRFSVAYGDFVDFQTNCENIEEAQAIADHITLIQNRPRIVEVITRERILDATETPDAKA